MKLLIADDDVTFLTILTGTTRKWGYEPIAVNDGEAAWKLMQESDVPKMMVTASSHRLFSIPPSIMINTSGL